MLKDIILVTAALVILARTFCGGRQGRGDPAPADHTQDEIEAERTSEDLRVVLDGVSYQRLIAASAELPSRPVAGLWSGRFDRQRRRNGEYVGRGVIEMGQTVARPSPRTGRR